MTAWCGSCRFKTYNDNAAPLLEEQYPKRDQFNVSEDETIGLWFNDGKYLYQLRRGIIHSGRRQVRV